MDENSLLLKIRKYIGPIKNMEIDKNNISDLLSLLNLYIDGKLSIFVKKIEELEIIKKIENEREYKIYKYKLKKRFLNYEIDLNNKFYCYELLNFYYIISLEKLEIVKNLQEIKKFNFSTEKSDLLRRRIIPDISIDEYVADLLSCKKYKEEIQKENESEIKKRREDKRKNIIREIENAVGEISSSSNYEIRDLIRDENKKGNILRKG